MTPAQYAARLEPQLGAAVHRRRAARSRGADLARERVAMLARRTGPRAARADLRAGRAVLADAVQRDPRARVLRARAASCSSRCPAADPDSSCPACCCTTSATCAVPEDDHLKGLAGASAGGSPTSPAATRSRARRSPARSSREVGLGRGRRTRGDPGDRRRPRLPRRGRQPRGRARQGRRQALALHRDRRAHLPRVDGADAGRLHRLRRVERSTHGCSPSRRGRRAREIAATRAALAARPVGPCGDAASAAAAPSITGAGGGLGRAFSLGFAAGRRHGRGRRPRPRRRAGDGASSSTLAGGSARARSRPTWPTRRAPPAMAAAALDAFGAIDVLVNNAAIYAGLERRPFDEIDAAEWDRVMAVNLKGPWLCAQACMPADARAGRRLDRQRRLGDRDERLAAVRALRRVEGRADRADAARWRARLGDSASGSTPSRPASRSPRRAASCIARTPRPLRRRARCDQAQPRSPRTSSAPRCSSPRDGERASSPGRRSSSTAGASSSDVPRGARRRRPPGRRGSCAGAHEPPAGRDVEDRVACAHRVLQIAAAALQAAVADRLGDGPRAVLEEPVEVPARDEVRRRDGLGVERRVAEMLVDVPADEGAQRVGRARDDGRAVERADELEQSVGEPGAGGDADPRSPAGCAGSGAGARPRPASGDRRGGPPLIRLPRRSGSGQYVTRRSCCVCASTA